ncbi:MAG: hypothetical protein HYV26_02400 [Candidatus Hydrogenedentes bacterium]|nr:hypothetical protein [Candidatus Hydrogenedentota bacterium]
MSSAGKLQSISSFPALVKYLREELEWPLETDDVEELSFDYEPEELGLDPKQVAQVKEIKQLRPVAKQPFGIFFLSFEKKRLPVVILRRVLSSLVIRKRASASKAHRAAWEQHDLLFISAYGEAEHRSICFAHFSEDPYQPSDLPALRVLNWDDRDTILHMDHIDRALRAQLKWPEDESDQKGWRKAWSAAFTERHREVITTSKQLAERLAALARKVRDRAKVVLQYESKREGKEGPLTRHYLALKQALIHDLSEDDFADMYAQTISYGLFSGSVSRPAGLTADTVTEMIPVTNRFLKELLEEYLRIGGRRRKDKQALDFDELGVNDVVEMLRAANMEAVLRDFNDRNPQEDPVIHFYELFLKEYDAKKRTQRGVFYTPQPVVSYIVRSVHELLQTEFGLEDGLADTTTWGEMLQKHPGLKLPPLTDEPGESRTISPEEPFVQILDPATGTATFLVKVVETIYETLRDKWVKQGADIREVRKRWNAYVPKHLLPRLHGYELLMAPYAIAHMKIGLILHATGYKFQSEERVRVYLTNALEPWVKQLSLTGFDALAHEAAAVNEVKREKRFTVVMGNPPYAGHSANKGDWMGRLLRNYYFLDNVPLNESNTKWLQDDYVKFIRLSQHVMKVSAKGVFGFITNHGYLDNPTFRGMRKSLCETFRMLNLLDLHGNSKKKERSPDGSADENVFEIQQGVAIVLGVMGAKNSVLNHAQLYGDRCSKYSVLRTDSAANTIWQKISVISPLYLFKPQDGDLRGEYSAFLPVNKSMPVHSLGVVTARDRLCIHFSKDEVWKTLTEFASLEPETARGYFDLGPDARDWSVEMAQADIRRSGLDRERLRPILYRPFDWRWTYYTGNSRGFHCMPRGEVMRNMTSSTNLGLSTNRSIEVGEFSHVSCSRSIIGHHCVSLKEVNYLFPLWLSPSEDELEQERRPNFSALVLGQFGQNSTPENIFHYIYSVFHSPGYRRRYAEFLKIDFPRVPLPGSLSLFQELAGLGGELVGLHLLESPKVEKFITKYVGGREPEVEKVSWSNDTVWVDKGQRVGFRGVTEAVWNFHIGGYQVCAKWLKDRKGRVLSAEDLLHYQKVVVALSETIRIMGEIDGVIEKHGGWPGAFGGMRDGR